jgi:glycosyltransferase involved in cell wall biosynthesis
MDSRMRVLMTALQPGGGIRTFFRYIYSQPCFEDCTFVLLAPDDGLTQFLSQYIPEGRLSVRSAPQGSLNFVPEARRLIRSGNFDLVHSHGFSAGTLTEVARGLDRTPHLMTAHDVFLPSQFAGLKGRVKHWLMAKLFGRMTGIHTVTEDARDNLLSFFPALDSSRVHGILHGVDTDYFRSGDPRDIRQEVGLDPDTPLVGFFGRFMGQKGFRLIVDAMHQIVSRDLLNPLPHVATFGWGGFIREDYAYLANKGLEGYFHQMKQTDDMSASLKGVDVVAMPSRWEACGLLAMEALSAGAPIIGSDCIGLYEVLEGSPAKRVPVGDSTALAHAIVEELKDRDQRQEAFRIYQQEAVERFAIDRPARALANLYTQLKTQAT